MSQGKPGWSLPLHAALAAGIAALAALAPLHARSQIADCETLAAGLAESVTIEAPLSGGDAVTVQALLRLPAGDRVGGAVVVLHGFFALHPPQCLRHNTDRLTDWGYATLLIDSPSQTTRAGLRMADYSSSQQAAHALAGAAYLARRLGIGQERIGVLGRSMGGLAAIRAVAGADAPFAAAVALYPFCPSRMPAPRAPLLMFVAGADSVVSAAACKAFAAADPASGIELVVYPRADHAFETPWNSSYDPAVSADAFARMRRHFAKYIGKGVD